MDEAEDDSIGDEHGVRRSTRRKQPSQRLQEAMNVEENRDNARDHAQKRKRKHNGDSPTKSSKRARNAVRSDSDSVVSSSSVDGASGPRKSADEEVAEETLANLSSPRKSVPRRSPGGNRRKGRRNALPSERSRKPSSPQKALSAFLDEKESASEGEEGDVEDDDCETDVDELVISSQGGSPHDTLLTESSPIPTKPKTGRGRPRGSKGPRKRARGLSSRKNRKDAQIIPKRRAEISAFSSSVPANWWAYCEFFYSVVDMSYFMTSNEFVECLVQEGIHNVGALTQLEWSCIRDALGRPRRLSAAFLHEEREKLNRFRDNVRRVRNGLNPRLSVPSSGPWSLRGKETSTQQMRTDAKAAQSRRERSETGEGNEISSANRKEESMDVNGHDRLFEEGSREATVLTSFLRSITPVMPTGTSVAFWDYESRCINYGLIISVERSSYLVRPNTQKPPIWLDETEVMPYRSSEEVSNMMAQIRQMSPNGVERGVMPNIHASSFLASDYGGDDDGGWDDDFGTAKAAEVLSSPRKGSTAAASSSASNLDTLALAAAVSPRHNGDVRVLAHAIRLLCAKDRNVRCLSALNDEVEKMSASGSDIPEEFQREYLKVIVSLGRLNQSLHDVLVRLRSSEQQSPYCQLPPQPPVMATPVSVSPFNFPISSSSLTPYSAASPSVGTPAQREADVNEWMKLLYQQCRNRAKDIVADQWREILSECENGRDFFKGRYTRQVRQFIERIIAFVLLLRECSQRRLSSAQMGLGFNSALTEICNARPSVLSSASSTNNSGSASNSLTDSLPESLSPFAQSRTPPVTAALKDHRPPVSSPLALAHRGDKGLKDGEEKPLFPDTPANDNGESISLGAVSRIEEVCRRLRAYLARSTSRERARSRRAIMMSDSSPQSSAEFMSESEEGDGDGVFMVETEMANPLAPS